MYYLNQTPRSDLAAAVRRLDRAIAADTMIRGEWTRTEKGRKRACLLAALVPACGVERTAAACPASVLPPWFAECVPWIDESGTVAAWPEMVRTFADLLRDSVGATRELWVRLNLHWRRAAIAEAMAHTENLSVLGICAEVAAMLDAELAGESINSHAWEDVRGAAWAVPSPTAAWAACWTTAWGKEHTAPKAAAWALPPGWAASADWVSRAGTEAEAADRITFDFFAAWRAELDAQAPAP